MKEISLSMNLFGNGITDVHYKDSVIGSIREDGAKIIAMPTNCKELPFDTQEQAIVYLITMHKVTAPKKPVLINVHQQRLSL